MIPVEVFPNLKVISMAFFSGERDNPVVWRGPLNTAPSASFWARWSGVLSISSLSIFPPGQGDEALSVAPSDKRCGWSYYRNDPAGCCPSRFPKSGYVQPDARHPRHRHRREYEQTSRVLIVIKRFLSLRSAGRKGCPGHEDPLPWKNSYRSGNCSELVTEECPLSCPA